MKLKKTFITLISIWLIFNILIEWKIPLLKDRNAIFQIVDGVLYLALLVMTWSLFYFVINSHKQKWLWVTIATFSIYPILWLIVYPTLPSGNHFLAIFQKNNNVNKFFYSEKYSTIILKIKSPQCDFPVISHLGMRLNKFESVIEDNAIFSIIAFIEVIEIKDRITSKFPFEYFESIVKRCGANTTQNGVTALTSAIDIRNSDIVDILVRQGADVNKKFHRRSGNIFYTPLYLAEHFLKSEKDETKKQSLIKIIELLKQAGAKSEKIDLIEKSAK